MLFVLGSTRQKVEAWRRRAGLPRRVVTPITTEMACRGRTLRYDEVVRLPDFEPTREMLIALIPCGVDPRKVAVVEGQEAAG